MQEQSKQGKAFDQLLKGAKLNKETCSKLMRLFLFSYRTYGTRAPHQENEDDLKRLIIMTRLLLRNQASLATNATSVFMNEIGNKDAQSNANSYQVKKYLKFCLMTVRAIYAQQSQNCFNDVNVLLLIQAVTMFLDPSLFVSEQLHCSVCQSIMPQLFPILRQLLIFAMNDNTKLLPISALLLDRTLISRARDIGTYFCMYILSIPLVVDRVKSIARLSSNPRIFDTIFDLNNEMANKLIVSDDILARDAERSTLPFQLYIIGNIVSLARTPPISVMYFKALACLMSNDKVIEYIHFNNVLTKSADEQLSVQINGIFDNVKHVELKDASAHFQEICSVYWVLIGNEDRKVDIINNLAYRTDFIASSWRYLSENKQSWTAGKLLSGNLNKVLYIFATCYHSLLVIQDDEEFIANEKPLSRQDLISLSGQLKDLVFDMHWNGCSDKALRKVLTQLLTHIHSRNSRTKFCGDEHFLMPSTVHIDFSTLTTQYMGSEDPMEIDEEEEIVYRPLRVQRAQALRSAMENRPVSSTNTNSDDQRVWNILHEIPYVIPFAKRVKVFHHFIERDREMHGMNWLRPVNVRRDYIFEDGYSQLNHMGVELKNDIRVQFISEDGHLEAGIGQGVFKEFIIQLSQVAFSANYGLFLFTQDGTIYPNPNSALVNNNDEDHFKFLGLIMGKALYEKILVDVPFARFFLSKLLGKTNYLNDLKSLDRELHKNLMFLKNYSGDAEDLSLNFTVSVDEFGQSRTINLIKDGANIPVTNQNKHLYIHRMAYFKLNTQIKRQSEAFQRGLSMIINKSWLQMFDENELYKLICGDEESGDVFSVDDMRKHTVYGEPFYDGHITIQLFWKVVESMNATQKRQLLKFITSSPRPPLLGFQDLDQKIAIRPTPPQEGLDRLPTSSTCVNLLKLPAYTDLKVMREKLLQAIENTEGFELT